MENYCPFHDSYICFLQCEFYNDNEIKTSKGKPTHCMLSIGLDDLHAIRKMMEEKKD